MFSSLHARNHRHKSINPYLGYEPTAGPETPGIGVFLVVRNAAVDPIVPVTTIVLYEGLGGVSFFWGGGEKPHAEERVCVGRLASDWRADATLTQEPALAGSLATGATTPSLQSPPSSAPNQRLEAGLFYSTAAHGVRTPIPFGKSALARPRHV